MPRTVGVVVPVYRAVELLPRAVESALEQRGVDVSVIVVDDGSPEDVRAAVDVTGSGRLTLLRQENRGQGAARNVGLGVLDRTIPWVTFLDADDFMGPGQLRRQVEVLERNPGMACVGTLMRYVDASDRALGTAGIVPDQADVNRIRHADLMPFPLSSTLFRRECLRPFDESLRASQDLDLLAYVARQGDVGCIGEVFGGYTVHSASTSVERAWEQAEVSRYLRWRWRGDEEDRSLTFAEFVRLHPPGAVDRIDFRTRRWYRQAGLAAAERDWFNAARFGMLAAVSRPRRTLKRLARQRHR